MKIIPSKPAQLRWCAPMLPGGGRATTGKLITLSGRVLEEDVTLHEACTLYLGETITVRL